MDVTERAASTERDARYRVLFAQVYGPVTRYVRRRADASHVDDVVADTMLVAWRRLDEIPAGVELAWCYSVARRVLANEWRSAARQLGLVARLEAQAATTTYDAPDDHPELTNALDGLAPDDRAVLELWAWEQLEPREIAVALGITPNAASIRLHRAKKRLRKSMTDGKDRATSGHSTGGHERESR